ncbi:GGDEF domain-containing protein [Aminobacter sp. AP02]|uniref:GGDEF domain-containing protein n=1 Tax=Aminobacter sp. AP02 TaxID=2135737 RepID=UPI000D6B0F80|nr:GGDEF domain-containing protein [Aminobacter sp. AP02]PWK68432.1 diguanylate cyclase (GGDEF)-like protein [Aminobacter sp. AP02]
MKSVILKTAAVTLVSIVGSLAMVLTIVPALGGTVGVIGWLMCILCPLAIATPLAFFTFLQGEKLKVAHADLTRAHAQLAAAHRRLSEKASRDEMTGMLNRENFFAALDGSRRKTDRGALLIIDADHFKQINDSFGHLTGDQALLQIASAITRGVRSGDILGRIGGEEFGAFLAGASEEEAKLVAERIRSEVERLRFQPNDEPAVPLTVSIGGTNCASEANVSELMRAADKRLYEAKRRGRNRAIFDTGISEAA